MDVRRSFHFAALGLVLALGACGGEGGGKGGDKGGGRGGDKETTGVGATSAGGYSIKSQAVENDLGRLVPPDAFLFAHCANPKALEGKVRAVMAMIDAKTAEKIHIDEILEKAVGPAIGQLNLSRPAALALSLPEGERKDPLVTIILAITDKEAFKKAMASGAQVPPMTFSGSYVAISQVPGHEAGSVPAIAATAPMGDIGVRVDLAALTARYGDEIQAKFAEGMEEGSRRPVRTPVPDMSGILSGVKDMFQEFIASAETLELGAMIENTRVDLAVKFTAKAGSPMAGATPASGELAELAGYLPEGMPIAVLLSMDRAKMWKFVEPMMEGITSSMPEEMRGGFSELMKKCGESIGLLGRESVESVGIDKDGLGMVGLWNVKDGPAYVANAEEIWFSKAMKDFEKSGFSISKGDTKTVSGVEVRSYRMDFDFERMAGSSGRGRGMPAEAKEEFEKAMEALFGKEGMVFRMAAVQNRIVGTMGGGEERMARVIAALAGGKRKPSGDLAAAIQRAGGKPSFLVNVEVRALASQIIDFVGRISPKAKAEMPTLPAGGPIPLLIYGTGDGRVYSGGLSVEVGEGARLIKALMESGRDR